jgi:non-specific serine/threonine protein kinase
LDFGLGVDPSAIQNPKSKIQNEEVLDLLTALIEKSLVQYEAREGERRYRLLETVRQYARDRLMESGEAETVRERHVGFFLQLAERAEPELRRHEQIEWLDRLEREHDNLRAALEWCRAAATGGEAELRLAGALAEFWIKRNYLSEGRHSLEGALSRRSELPPSLRIPALLGAGNIAMWVADYTAAVSFLQAGLDLARATGDPKAMAAALSTLGIRAAVANDSRQATALAEESLVRAREAGDPWLTAFGLQALGVVVRMSGDLDRAATLFHDSLALARQVGDKWSMIMVLVNLGGVAQARGDDDSARRAYQESLALSQELKDRRGMAWCLECLAEVAAGQDQPQRGARLMGAAEGLLEAIGASWPPNYVAGRERALAAIRAALGDETAAAVLAEGRAMTLAQAVCYALEATRTA